MDNSISKSNKNHKHSSESLYAEKDLLHTKKTAYPQYGDVTKLNTQRTILDLVGKETLALIVADLVDLLETSVAIYEENGDYAFGIFNSGWCQLMDSASRKLCNTDDNEIAIKCGKWLCHEDCWNNSAKIAIASKQAIDINCIGGIKLFTEPIFANKEVIGTISIGYGDPPKDKSALQELAKKYNLDLELLKTTAIEYNSRPEFIIDLAKKRLSSAAKLIGEIIVRKKTEQELIIAKQKAEENEFLLNETGELAKIGGWKIDIKTQKLTWTKQVYNIHEVPYDYQPTIEEAINFYDDRSKNIIKKAVENAITYGKPFNVDLVITTTKGNKLHVKALGKIQFDIAGKPEIIFGTFQDITQQKSTEQALKDSENRYKVLFEQAAVGVAQVDTQTSKFIRINTKYADLLGYTIDEMLNLNFQEITHPEDLEVDLNNMELLKKNRISEFSMEKRYYHKNGNIVWVELFVSPMWETNSAIDYHIAVVSDITQRKQAEKALKESETLLLKIAENYPNSYLSIVEKDFTIGFTSGMEFKKQNLNPNDFIGLSLEQVYGEHTAFVKQQYTKTFNGETIEFELNMNNQHQLYKIVPLYDNNNNISRILAVVENITERKKAEQALIESEEKYRFITDNIQDLVWRMDIKTRKLTYVSPSVYNNTGYTVEEYKSLKIEDLMTTESLEKSKQRIVDRFNKLLKGDVSAKSGIAEYQMINKDGSIVWVETSTTFSSDSFGNAVEIIGVARNISKRKEQEILINQQNKDLQRLNSDKDLFMQILAHDLKNPFNSLLGFSALLLKNFRKYDDNKIENHITQIHNVAGNAYNLLNDLLLWSKSQSGKLTIRPETVAFMDICSAVIHSFQSQADKKGITINCFEAETSVLFTDNNMLKTILRNLISNAIKFTNKKGQINIYTIKKHDHITITVSDDGVGIGKENIAKLWDFTQATSTRGTSNEKGTGFGLLVCKEFVEKQGGKIWVESEIGKGSVFRFTVPFLIRHQL